MKLHNEDLECVITASKQRTLTQNLVSVISQCWKKTTSKASFHLHMIVNVYKITIFLQL